MECEVRYAASFFGYGFYGDVTRESESLRWLGPMRYDYVGLLTYLRHKSYEAEVAFFHMPDTDAPNAPSQGIKGSSRRPSNLCTSGCRVCASSQDLSLLARSALGFQPSLSLPDMQHTGSSTHSNSNRNSTSTATSNARDSPLHLHPSASCPSMSPPTTPSASSPSARKSRGEGDVADVPGQQQEENEEEGGEGKEDASLPADDDALPGWRTVRGCFHSVGGAVISCRNDKAPDGIAAHAHLADGHLNLIMVHECSRPEYLQQLLSLAWKGADPFDYSFVEHHKTPAFTFKALGECGYWNVDGELVEAKELSAQVFRGLVDVFATGPEK